MLLQDPLFYLFLSIAHVSPLSDIEYEVSVLSFMLYETTFFAFTYV